MVCKEFLEGFLNCMDVDLQDRITEAIHGFKNMSIDELARTFQEIAFEIEKAHGIDSFEGHVVVRKFMLLLNKREDKAGAEKFLEEKLQRIGKDEFHTLLTLSSLQDKNGEYEKALLFLDRAKKTISDDDVLMKALIELKLAANSWNFESKSVKSCGHQEMGMMYLGSLHAECTSLTSPATIKGLMFIDAFETAGYLYRIQDNQVQSAANYEKALNIIKKCPVSKFHHMKGLTHVSASRARTPNSYQVRSLLVEAMEIVNELLEDEDFMMAHPDAMVHVLSRISHSYTLLKDLNGSVEIRLKILDIIKNYLGEEHPEGARSSANMALNYFFLRDSGKSEEYITAAEDVLENSGYKEDVIKSKLYFREISDALRILGNLFCMMSEYGNSEKQYLLSIDLHIKVYGENHQRISKVYRYLGKLYSRWEKQSQAVMYLNKALDVQRLYLPSSRDLIKSIEKDLALANNPKKRRPRYSR